MNIKEILPIIEEFNGRRCTLRLTNGNFITGIMGEIQSSTSALQLGIMKVFVLEKENQRTSVYLNQIKALRLE